MLATRRVGFAQETFTTLKKLPASTDTCCKPQSKLWFHDDRWWAVMPSTSVSPTGTWLWRLETDNSWRNVLRLSSATGTRADARRIIQLDANGDAVDVTHVLLHASTAQLASVEYDAGARAYKPWSVRPTLTSVALSGSETATIDIDSNDRIWLSTESGSSVRVYYADYPYTTFKGPLILANNILEDDITVVIALPDQVTPKIGVFWSNQGTKVFGFRVHPDAADKDPEDLSAWGPDETPGDSAPHVGAGVADDHMHVAVASDGTLYVSIKTSYNSSSLPLIGLLVRHPDGVWDNLYQVDTSGTRPIVLLNEPLDLLRVVYTSATGGGNIVYRDSLMSAIGFGSRKTLISGSLNNATSTKEDWTDQVVVLASGQGVLIRDLGVTTTTLSTTTTIAVTTTTATSTTVIPGSSTTTSTTSIQTTTTASTTTTTTIALPTTTTTLPPGGTSTYQAGVSGPPGTANVDTNIRLSTPSRNWGSDPNLYVGVTNAPDNVYRTLIAFDLSDLPDGAVITSCKLIVNVTQRTNPTAGHIRRLCDEHWTDGDGQSETQATWVSWQTGSPWTTAGAGSTAPCASGGDYSTTDEIAYTPPAGTGSFTFPDLTVLCRDAVAAQGGWLRLRFSQDAETTQSNLFKFDSSDAATAGNRPKLVVTWSPP